MKEVWKDIKGYEKLYQVSTLGKVKSLSRFHKTNKYYSSIGYMTKEKILKEKKAGRGQYRCVCLHKDGKVRYKTIHRLVAETFIPNPNNFPQVNHKDENPLNNSVDNLEWCTNKQNHNYGTGHKRTVKHTDYAKRSLYFNKSVVQCDLDGNVLRKFPSIKIAATETNTPYSGIIRCCRYENKTSGGYKWLYNNRKFFCISDNHGCFDETIRALNKVGYDENNPYHTLVCLGDFTDRGSQSVALYEYLYRLDKENKAVVLLGNHGLFLIEFLEGSYSSFNYLHNGLRETIADFWHRTAPFESWCMLEGNCEMNQESYVKWVDICRKDIMEEYTDLLPWLKSLPRYFESKNYIGVHGAIDTNVPGWHYPHCYRYNLRDWDALDFDDGSFFGKEILNTGKNIIIGHFGTRALRKMYNIDLDNKNQFAPLLSKNGRILAIDATTNYSHQVNVAVIEDELL